ncbi:MAG: ZIP family metal transporter [Lawsonibacter sp.]|nr:ZIP family metal transporter [Lawsonibacter sp.]
MTQALLFAAGGTGFTALMTALGAAIVFLFQPKTSPTLHRVMLGFAAGVMIAASMWSLLIPAIEKAEALGMTGWLPAAGGSILGIAFLLLMDQLLPHFGPESFHRGEPPSRTALLVLAVTLHNIPEGMAVGVSFALAAQSGDAALLTASTALAIGIGIQNFPEGAAISLPLYQEGMHKGKAFWIGAASGIVEPIFALLTVLVAGSVQIVLPWLLSFAAGAMLYVVVEELIPEANLSQGGHAGTLGVMAGFLIMMILDVALG